MKKQIEQKQNDPAGLPGYRVEVIVWRGGRRVSSYSAYVKDGAAEIIGTAMKVWPEVREP